MGLDKCFDALRFLSRSSDEATRLTTAELLINELLEQVKLKPAAQRALLAALNREVKREAEIGPGQEDYRIGQAGRAQSRTTANFSNKPV